MNEQAEKQYFVDKSIREGNKYVPFVPKGLLSQCRHWANINGLDPDDEGVLKGAMYAMVSGSDRNKRRKLKKMFKHPFSSESTRIKLCNVQYGELNSVVKKLPKDERKDFLESLRDRILKK